MLAPAVCDCYAQQFVCVKCNMLSLFAAALHEFLETPNATVLLLAAIWDFLPSRQTAPMLKHPADPLRNCQTFSLVQTQPQATSVGELMNLP